MGLRFYRGVFKCSLYYYTTTTEGPQYWQRFVAPSSDYE
jgi:hypothetical protein